MHERRIEEGETNAGNVFILDLFCLKLHSHFALDFPIATDQTEPNRTAPEWQSCGNIAAVSMPCKKQQKIKHTLKQ